MERINKTETLYEILNNKIFTIDVYQREYRWGRKQIAQMIDDLTDSFLSYYHDGRFKHEDTEEVAQYGYYFMGSIIRTGDDSTREIIDGQQRLTSLTLLLIYINHLLHENGNHILDTMLSGMIYSSPFGWKKTFNINVDERKACMEKIYAGDLNFNPENESSKNLLDRYKDIDELFRDEITEDILPYFAFWVMQKVLLLEIVTPSQQDAHTIFITMNDRGLSLNSAEMLKAYILNEIHDSKDKAEVNLRWQQIVGKIKEESGTDQSGIVNTADVEFISVWLRGNYARTLRENRKDSEDKDYELLGEKFYEWVRKNAASCMGLKRSSDFKEFVLKEMQQIADVYLRIKAYSQTYTKGYESVFYNANRDLNYQTLLIISAVDKNDSAETVDQKIKLVSRFVDIFASNKLLNYRKANFNTNKVTLFKVLVNIRNQSVKDIAIILTKALKASDAGWDRFDSLHYDNQFFKRYALHFLARFTAFINENMGNPSDFEKYVNRHAKNPYDIEHILPNAYDDYADAFQSEDEFHSERQKLGNLILLTKDRNRSYQDMTYSKKVALYARDNVLAQAMNEASYRNNPHFIALANKYGIKPYEQINKRVICERAQMYSALAKDIWNISSLREIVGGWSDEEYDAIKYDTVRNIINHEGDGNKVWVIACNAGYYDIIGAFRDLDEIEWQQNAGYEVGDTVYIYLTLPYAEIGYKCLVTAKDISPANRNVDDAQYLKSDTPIEAEKYFRMRLLASYRRGSLTWDRMRKEGVKSTFQGPTIATGVLLDVLNDLDKEGHAEENS